MNVIWRTKSCSGKSEREREIKATNAGKTKAFTVHRMPTITIQCCVREEKRAISKKRTICHCWLQTSLGVLWRMSVKPINGNCGCDGAINNLLIHSFIEIQYDRSECFPLLLRLTENTLYAQKNITRTVSPKHSDAFDVCFGSSQAHSSSPFVISRQNRCGSDRNQVEGQTASQASSEWEFWISLSILSLALRLYWIHQHYFLFSSVRLRISYFFSFTMKQFLFCLNACAIEHLWTQRTQNIFSSRILNGFHHLCVALIFCTKASSLFCHSKL